MSEFNDLLDDLGFAAAKTEHDRDEIRFAASQLCGLRTSRDSGNWALPGAEPEREEPLTPIEEIPPDVVLGAAGEIGAINIECSRGDVVITTPVSRSAFVYLHSLLDVMMLEGMSDPEARSHESLTLVLIGEVNNELWMSANDFEPLLWHSSFNELRVLTVICATSELSEITIRDSMKSLVVPSSSGYSVPIEVSVIDNRN